jgi:YndJ-like protein
VSVRKVARALGLQALAGLVLWVVVAIAGVAAPDLGLDLIPLLLLFAQLVVVPLGLLLLTSRTRVADAFELGARLFLRLGALAALATLAFPAGAIAGVIAAVWLLPTGFAGLSVLADFVARPRLQVASLARLAGGGFLVAGASFFVASRLGLRPMGFSDEIVVLTAVHFHVTGFAVLFAAAELCAEAARVSPAAERLATAAAGLLLAGMLVTPLGFVAAAALQLVGALLVAAGVLLLAATTALVVLRGRVAGAARVTLATSALSALAVGGLAAVYAISAAGGSPVISIPAMAATHGVLGVIGVAGGGLLGWRLVRLAPG